MRMIRNAGGRHKIGKSSQRRKSGCTGCKYVVQWRFAAAQ